MGCFRHRIVNWLTNLFGYGDYYPETEGEPKIASVLESLVPVRTKKNNTRTLKAKSAEPKNKLTTVAIIFYSVGGFALIVLVLCCCCASKEESPGDNALNAAE